MSSICASFSLSMSTGLPSAPSIASSVAVGIPAGHTSAGSLGTALFAGPALAADRPPPPNAMPLSQVLQALEKQGQVAHFDDIEWEDDGYWEVKYVFRGGGTVKVKIDPVSGEIKK